MGAGNKISLQDVKAYEITIAKCGWLELVWLASPLGYSKYKIRSNNETIYETMFLSHAMQRYNDIVQ